MAKISNTGIYPNIDPVLADYFILTDGGDDLATKTCTLTALQKLYNLDVTSVTKTVSSVLLNVLATQDFELLAAPGSGYVLDIQKIIVFMNPGSPVYDFDSVGSIDMGALATGDITTATLNSATDYVASVFNGTAAVQIPENTALILSKAGGNPTQGNGILYVNISYRTLKLDSTF